MYQDIYEYFLNGPDDVFAPTMLGPMNSEGLLGFHGTPNMPVFVYHSVNDEMCPVKYVDPLIKKYCDNGANIWMHRNARGNHNVEGYNGRQRGLDFLTDVIGEFGRLGGRRTAARSRMGSGIRTPTCPIIERSMWVAFSAVIGCESINFSSHQDCRDLKVRPAASNTYWDPHTGVREECGGNDHVRVL